MRLGPPSVYNGTGDAMRRICTLCVAILIGVVGLSAPAHAVDRKPAANYADSTWNARPGQWPSFSDDCANFVSQSEYAGNIQFRIPPNFTWEGYYTTTQYWYAQNSPGITQWTTSWTVAEDNSRFMQTLLNGMETDVPPTKEGAQPPSGYKNKADIVYYDWNSDGHIDHASIIVRKSATDPDSGLTGTLIDQHTTDRKHAIWHLKPWNSREQTTLYYLEHVDNTAY